jgi:hypothetical protein
MSKHRVTLKFKSKAQRDWFIGQLTDGFGENECETSWSKGINACDADEINVDVTRNETFQHHRRVRRSFGL